MNNLNRIETQPLFLVPLSYTAPGEAVVDTLTVSQAPVFVGLHANSGSQVDIMRNASAVISPPQQNRPISATVLELQAQLRMRWSTIIARAQELETLIPDPIQAMIDLLGGLPGNYDAWREIIEEPYG